MRTVSNTFKSRGLSQHRGSACAARPLPAPRSRPSELCGQLRPAARRRFRGTWTDATRFQMRWFGFGFDAFGQIRVRGRVAEDVKVIRPTELAGACCPKTCRVRASWSRRASLHLTGESVLRRPVGHRHAAQAITNEPSCSPSVR